MNTYLPADKRRSARDNRSIKKSVITGLQLCFGICLLMLLPSISRAADIIMHTGVAVASDGDNFYDSGGPSDDYVSYENYTLTLYPSIPGTKLTVNFTDFEIETCCDQLSIYNGSSTSASLIGSYTTSPGTVTSTAADGSLTFVFKSDPSLEYLGWEASISTSAVSACSGSVTGGTALASVTSICPGKSLVLTLSGVTAATGLTYQWDTSSTGTGGWAAVAGATSVPFIWIPPAGTALYYRCNVTCTATSATDVSSSVVVSSAASPLPYTEDFESTSPGSFPACTDNTYTASNGFNVRGSTTYPSLGNHTAPTGTRYLFAGYYTGMNDPDYFFTPSFSMEPGKTYEFSYWYQTDGYGPYTLGAYVGTAQTKAAMTTPITGDLSANNTSYEQYVGTFTVSSAGSYCVGIKVAENSYMYGIAIDDIGLQELPLCTGTPAYAGKANVSPAVICSGPGSTTLSVTKTAPVSGLTFQWYEASALTGPYTAISGATTNPYEATSVSADRYYYCAVGCSAGGTTVNSDTVTVKVAPLTPPYIEDFETGKGGVNMPCADYTYGWDKYSYWWLYDGSHVYSWVDLYNHTTGGNKWLYAGGGLGSSSGEAEYWFTPGINFTAGKAYSLTYWYNTDGYENYELGARYGMSQSKSDMTAMIGEDIKSSTTSYTQYTGDFVVGTTGVYYIGIRFKASNWNYGASIDDIGLVQLPPCSAKPAAGTTVASPTMICDPGASGTSVSLKGLSAASDLTYQWQSSTTGAAGSYTDIAGATDPSYNTDPITDPTYFRCVVVCPLIGSPNADTSEACLVKVGPLLPPYIEDFETATAGVNQPCASYTYDFESSTSTSGFDSWGIKDMPGAWSASMDNHTPGGSKYLSAGYNIGSYNLGPTDGDQQYWFTPGLALTKDMAYKCSFWYVAGYSGEKINYGLYYGNSQDASSMNAMMPDIVGEGNTDYKQIQGAFTAAASGVYYIGVKVNHTNYGSDGAAIDDIGIEQLPLCSAKPAAGIVNSVPTQVCNTGKAKLSVTGYSMASMLAFQWQDSTAGGVWANVTGGSGATTQLYTTAVLSVTHWYRCIVSCSVISAPGNSDTTAAYQLNVGTLNPPYIETFESGREGFNMPCASNTSGWSDGYQWYLYASPYDPYYYAIDNHTPGGSKYLYGGSGLTGSNAYWFSPAINFTKDSTYEFSYWYNGSGYTGGTTTFGMYYGTAQTSGSMVAIRTDLTGVNTTTYTQLVGRFKAPATNKYYLGIKVRQSSVYSGVAIDDIGLNQLPPCSGVPTAGVISSNPVMLCSAGTVKLDMDFRGVTKASGLSYRWEWTNTDPAAGFTAAGSGPAQAAPAYTSPTFSSTTWLRCIVKCTLSGDSVISSVLKLDVGVIMPPYIETFESGTTGVNMPCASYSGSWSPSYDPSYYWYLFGAPYSSDYPTADNHTPGGTKYLFAGYGLGYTWGIPGASYWFTPAIRFTGGKLYQFSYWYNGTGYSGAGSTLGAYYGTAQNAAAMTTAIGTDMVGVNTNVYKQYKTRFTPSTTGDYYIGIKVQNPTDYSPPGIAIDDIGLQEVPACSEPVVAGVIESDPLHVCSIGSSVNLDLPGSTLATGLSYQWFTATDEAGPYTSAGFSSLPYTTDPLMATTWYRCVVTCSASGASDTTDPYQVKVGAFELPYVEDFESTTVGGIPTCSDATFWGSYFYDGFKVVRNGTYTSDYYNHTSGGSKYLIAGMELGSSDYYSPLTDYNFWFSPGLQFRAGYKYRLSFYYIGAASGYSNRMGVYYGTSQSVGAMSKTIVGLKKVSNSSYVQVDTVFTPSASGVYYLGFQKTTTSSGSYAPYGIAFDDINLNYAPCDEMPAAGSIRGELPSGTAFCYNKPVTLTNIGATYGLVPGIQFQWERRSIGTPGGWLPVAGATDTVLKSDTLVGYEYRMRVICANTNDTARSPVFSVPALPVHPPVFIMPAATPVSFCLGDTVRLTATNFSGAVYDWMKDSVTMSGWKFSDMGATDPGSYTVRVVSPLSPCPAYSTPVVLNQNDPGYSVLITTPSDSIICAGEAVTLYAAGSKAGLSYQWRKDNIAISGAVTTSLVVETSGWYRIVAFDGLSVCPAVSRNVLIQVKPNPEAKITVPGATLTACENEGLRLDANTGGYSYQWNHSGSPVFGWVDSSVMVHHSGRYTVKVRTADGCVNTSDPIDVTILPSPVPVISRTGMDLGTALYVKYTWIRNGDDTVSRANSFTLTKQGLYKVVVEDANGCVGESLPMDITDATLGIANTTVTGADIKVFPNPTRSTVYIQSPVPVKVEVKDATGKTVYEKSVTKEVNLAQLADGVYMFVITDKHGEQLLKQQRVTKISK